MRRLLNNKRRGKSRFAYLPNASLISKANKASTHLKKDVDRYVTRKPYRVMGVLMLASMCIGFLMNRH